MKYSLLSIIMVVVATPAFAQSVSPLTMMSPEASTASLITAGIVALGIARRNADKKVTKS